MDLALLAVTALGFIGVFLMLPREKATLARIGALVGALGLAGFFLVLVRAGAESGLVRGGPPVYFYLFATIMIVGTVGVIAARKAVYAALYFVLVTLAGAGIFVLLLAEFMAIVLIIVYAGAILVTYVFVIMLASSGATEESPEYDRFASGPLVAVFVSFVLLGAVLQVMFPAAGRAAPVPERPEAADRLVLARLSPGGTLPPPEGVTIPAPAVATGKVDTGEVKEVPATQAGIKVGNVLSLGATLYGRYVYSLELAGVLLTIALIGAVVIARKNVDSEQPVGTGQLPGQ